MSKVKALFSKVYFQSMIISLLFFLVLSFPIIIGMTNLYSVVNVASLSTICFIIALFGSYLGRQILKNDLIGGFLGGVAGLIFFLGMLYYFFIIMPV